MNVRLNSMNGGRYFVGILEQQNHCIGLFEILRIQQMRDSNVERIVWIRSVVSPFSNWVIPRAQLISDPFVFGPNSEAIDLLCGDSLRFNENGQIHRHLISLASLTRIPYNVSFWEHTDNYPVYTLYPDNRLPWDFTVRSHYIPPQQNRVEEPVRVERRTRRLSVDAVCPITLEPLSVDDAVWTPCGHAFSSALYRALAIDARCPMCRAPINRI